MATSFCRVDRYDDGDIGADMVVLTWAAATTDWRFEAAVVMSRLHVARSGMNLGMTLVESSSAISGSGVDFDRDDSSPQQDHAVISLTACH